MLTLPGKFVVAIVPSFADFSFSGRFISGSILKGEVKLEVSSPSDALVCRLT
jgi:hypothetical protein